MKINPKLASFLSEFNKAVKDFGNSIDKITKEISNDVNKINKKSKLEAKKNQRNLDKLWSNSDVKIWSDKK